MPKNRKKVRGNSRFYIYWVVLLGVVFYGGYHLTTLFRETSLFRIKEIHIKGNRLVDKDILYNIAEPFKGVNFFSLNVEDLALRFQAMSRIKSIKTMRIFPSRLIITVRERNGVFYVKDNSGEFHPIDNERFILDKADWYLEEDLPLININIPRENIIVGQKLEDPRIEYIFYVYDIMTHTNPDILPDISEFYFIRNDLYFVDMQSGSRVVLSTEDLSQQINRFVFLRNNQGFDRNSTIDLRFGSQIVVR
ncbi:MAG: FtsQ-type POTRA domain-containing protein [Candidatus Cloacimonetes bacterium]|nr:FtsQ-type POTRA domain-containing protein [Candidatus Cloacimonadota bacterium]